MTGTVICEHDIGYAETDSPEGYSNCDFEEEAHKGRPTPHPESTTVTVLVADDDASISRLLKTFLEREGYRVQMRLSSAEALDLCQRQPDQIQLMVMELSLLGGSAHTRRESMRRIPTGLPLLLTSRDSLDLVLEANEKRPAAEIIPKPFYLQDVGQAVLRALREPPRH